MRLLKIIKKCNLFIINTFLSGTHFFAIKRFMMNIAGYKIGKNTKIVGPLIISTNLSIGENCWIGRDFKCYGNGNVIIGNNCDIAPHVIFSTGGHEIGKQDRRAGEGVTYNINVGNGVWIGVNCTLCKNISIGDMSVIGACACVVNNIESNVIVGGVPAKIIRRLDE